MAPSTGISLFRHNNDLTSANILLRKLSTTTSECKTPSYNPQLNVLVLNPAFITQDFDALRFEAAAHNQLPNTESESSAPNSNANINSLSPVYSTNLISSPYNNAGHYLDLSSLSTSSRLFALALTALKPTRSDYATASYTESLNFDIVLSVLREIIHHDGFIWKETSFYVVIFKSKLNSGVDQDWLYKLDYESHGEACRSGGLLKYWFGKADLDGDRRNLATCFWRSREDAHKGGLGPWHTKARAAGRSLYESITFSTHRFTVTEGAEGYRFEEYRD